MNKMISNDFSQGSLMRHVLKQSIPLSIAYFIQLLYNIVDRIYIGHLNGADGRVLTGIGIVIPIISIIAAFTNLFASGGAPLFSIARGAGEKDDALDLKNQTFSLLAITSIVLTIGFVLFKRDILHIFGASEGTFVYANRYFSIYVFGTFFSMVGNGMIQFINAEGFAKEGMMIVIAGAVINIILDPVFIFLLNMGIGGAALATVFAQICSFVLVVKFLLGDKTAYPMIVSRMRLKIKNVGRIVALGLAGFVMEVSNSLVQAVCNISVKHYGGDLSITIMTIINSVREIVNIAITGISNGAKPVIGYNYGARKGERVKKTIVICTVLSLGYTLFIWVLIMLIPGVFIRIFNSDPRILEDGIIAMKLYFSGIFFMSFQFVGQTTFVAVGKAKNAIFFSIFRKIIIVIPLTILLPRLWGMGIDGVYIAEPISNIIGGCACMTTMLFVVRKELKKYD
ncbi:MAG: MATE family efflux transporter [Eubacterium sp.]|nr:MATE family efflux transporter [Eubacterium sp.]